MKISNAFFLIVFCLSFPIAAFSRDATPKKVYVAPDGKIYVKSKQPIFIRLTTSSDENAESYLLRNQISLDPKKPVQPYYLEGHGRHSLVHPPDHKNLQNRKGPHLFYIHDDGRSPKTKVSVTKAPWVLNGKVNIYGKPVKVSLKVTDPDSGVFGGFFSLNSSPFETYTTPLLLDREMDYKLQYYAIDNVSNRSRTRTILYSLDFTAPVTTHRIIGGHIKLGAEDILSPRSKITLKSTDAKAGVKQIRYRFKGKKGIYKGGRLNMKGLKDGIHSLVYAAGDRVQNSEANKTFTFYLDSVPPVVHRRISGDRYKKGKKLYVSGRTRVELTATDNKAGVRRIRYFIRSKRGTIYSSPFTFPKRNGFVKYSYAASDNVINISKTAYHSVIVDISPPRVVPKFRGEHYYSRKTHYIRLSTVVSLSTSDNLSGVKSISYTLDESSDIRYQKPFQVETEGEHTLSYNAVDNVNNRNRSRMIKLYVDEKAPEIYHHFSVNPTQPESDVYPLKTLLYLAATDKQSGIRNIFYRVNGGKETRFKKPLSFKIRKRYAVKIKVIDNVGNVSRSEIDFGIK